MKISYRGLLAELTEVEAELLINAAINGVATWHPDNSGTKALTAALDRLRDITEKLT